MHLADADYFRARADTHLALARQASTPAASETHYELSTRYLMRAHADTPARARRRAA